MVSRIKKISFGHRLLLAGFIVCLLVACALYIVIPRYAVLKAEQNLVSLCDQRTEEIKHFLQTNEQAIQLVFEQNDVLTLIDDLVEQKKTHGKEPLAEQFSRLLESYKHKLDYKTCVVCDLDGAVIFADDPGYTNLSLKDKTFKESALGISIQQVLMTLTTDIAEFAYDPVLMVPAIFITVPIFKDRKLFCLAALRLDEQNFYDITNNYIGLGATGDLNIAKRKSGGVLYLDKIRNEFLAPFKKFLPHAYTTIKRNLSPMQLATLGYTGVGKILDSRNIVSLASWGYIQRMNIGMAAKINYETIFKPLAVYKTALGLLFFLLLGLFFVLAHYDEGVKKGARAAVAWVQGLFFQESQLRKVLYIIWILSLVGALGGIYYLYSLKKDVAREKEGEVSAQMTDAQQQIDKALYTVELITQTLSYNIKLGYLNEEQLIARLKYNLTENPIISGISVAYAPYAHDKNQNLFGRYVTRTQSGIETYNLDELYDYTKESITDAPYRAFYLEGIAKRDVSWIDPFIEPLSKKFVAACSNDFYTTDEKELIAVVTVFVDMDSIDKIIESSNLSAKGTSFLLSQDGVFLYHPSIDYKKQKRTIVEMAQTLASPELISVWNQEEKKLHGLYSFKNVADQEEKKAYFVSIEQTNWLLGTFFSASLVEPSLSSLRHHYVILLFSIVFFVICSLMICFKVYKAKNRNSLIRFLVLSIPLFICFSLLIYICYTHQGFQDRNKQIITTPLELEQFLLEKKEVASIIHESAPIPIVTGLEIDSLEPLDKGGVITSGFIWQYYDDITHKGIEPDVLFTQASRKIELVKEYETKMGTLKIIGWKFFAEIPYEWNEVLYPLDVNKIPIQIEHPDYSKNIVLVPDLTAYQSMRPTGLPGLASKISLLGFNIESSFFSFSNAQPKTTYGVEAFGQSTAYLALNFDIIVARNILNSILIFFLPVFIIMFSIYCFFTLSENKMLDLKDTLTAYTGILLTIIFLHRMLRDQRATGNVMYIEYFFILTYITVFILTFHVFFQQTDLGKKGWYKELVNLYKIFFWDIQLFIGIAVTTLIFY